jgi:hypothetical protein
MPPESPAAVEQRNWGARQLCARRTLIGPETAGLGRPLLKRDSRLSMQSSDSRRDNPNRFPHDEQGALEDIVPLAIN